MKFDQEQKPCQFAGLLSIQALVATIDIRHLGFCRTCLPKGRKILNYNSETNPNQSRLKMILTVKARLDLAARV